MIIITLLHPTQNIPLQSWLFENEDIISIGRSIDNDVVVYSSVVSRCHVQLQKNGQQWEIINIGTNGTYLNEKEFTKIILEDNMIIRLADTGPKIKINMSIVAPENLKIKRKHNKKASSIHDQIKTFIRDV